MILFGVAPSALFIPDFFCPFAYGDQHNVAYAYSSGSQRTQTHYPHQNSDTNLKVEKHGKHITPGSTTIRLSCR